MKNQTPEYHYLDDIAIADAAFEAKSADLEGLFRAAADATMNVMVDPLDSIRNETSRRIRVADDALDMLLFQFLQELIYFKDAEDLLLRVADLRIDETPDGYALDANAFGETMDVARHRMHVDVKAVTLHRFRVEKTGKGWETTVVLDI